MANISIPKELPELSKEDQQAQRYNAVGRSAVKANVELESSELANVFEAIRNCPEPAIVLGGAKNLIAAIDKVFVNTINSVEDVTLLTSLAVTLQKDDLPNLDKDEMVNHDDDDLSDYSKVDCSKLFFLGSPAVSSHEVRLYVLNTLSKHGVLVEFDKQEVFNGLSDVIHSVVACYPRSSTDSVRSGFYDTYVVFVKKD